jgi:ProP effector
MSQLNTSTPSAIKAPQVPTPSRSAYTVRQILVDRFPACFRPKRTAKLPIKIGIHKDIRRAAPDLTAREIARALADYTRGPTYLGVMLEGIDRFDLYGRPEGVVTAAHAKLAQHQLSKIVADMNKRETAKRTHATQ